MTEPLASPPAELLTYRLSQLTEAEAKQYASDLDVEAASPMVARTEAGDLAAVVYNRQKNHLIVEGSTAPKIASLRIIDVAGSPNELLASLTLELMEGLDDDTIVLINTRRPAEFAYSHSTDLFEETISGLNEEDPVRTVRDAEPDGDSHYSDTYGPASGVRSRLEGAGRGRPLELIQQ